ncbi:TetR/AcrR family transcriptional regulator [Streptomyces carminius]|uniref:TetR/AcrR family transcriptional regulator n=1 Tax=Streptomyces carminius TaxID=2665496 RepID=A0A2M8M1A6_9ACTN|nr:TetR/AcrR family transcriptional regulator [Streptomyces carminius]PJE97987.1 TetR/AcrR family transcriptional regulator [Streptomyces carminius]PJF01813.1 TetR/AcrR family transcriptional regulator [Streptomyces carminius]
MPLPRFHRLPPERRREILETARSHFARDGPDNASYNAITAAAGLSKSAAYQYFDGRQDLLAAVLDGVRDRLTTALGPWRDAGTAEEFWAGLRAGSRRLVRHLAAHPDDLALADAAVTRAAGQEWTGWFATVLDNGRALGVVRDDVDRRLMLSATMAVMHTADRWALRRVTDPVGGFRADDADDTEQVWSLLAGLWGPRTAGRTAGGSERDG